MKCENCGKEVKVSNEKTEVVFCKNCSVTKEQVEVTSEGRIIGKVNF